MISTFESIVLKVYGDPKIRVFKTSKNAIIDNNFRYLRVVILNQGTRAEFSKEFDFFRGSEFMTAPFFLKRHETIRDFLTK